MKKLYDEARAKLIFQLMRICNPETTVGDLEMVVHDIERMLVEEKILK